MPKLFVPHIVQPPLMKRVTWSPTDKGSDITLSADRLTATGGATGCGVRATVAHNTGKYYFEGIASGLVSGANSPKLGLGAGTLDLTVGNVWFGATDGGCGFPANDGISPLHFYSNTGGPLDLNIGNLVDGVSVQRWWTDYDAGKIWIGLDSSIAFGGNPVAGTTPTLTFTPNTALFPMMRSAANGSAVAIRLAGSAWAYSSLGYTPF